MDFGTGAFANVRRFTDYDAIDAVVISHMHADHFLDLLPLRYALKYGEKRRGSRMPLWVPPGGASVLRTMAGALASEGDEDFWDEALDVREFDPDRALPIGHGELHFAPTTHYIPSFAIRYQRNGTSITYSADTAPDASVVRIASGTDLFLCEATLLAHSQETGVRGHSSASEAGAMAREAGVKHLVLTHYGEHARDVDLRGGAAGSFDGKILVADDLDEFSTAE